MSGNEKNVPKRRFKEFQNAGAWEQRKLDELSTLITKGTTPLDKSGNGNINFIKIENIDLLSSKIISTTKITEEEHNGHLKRSQLRENDILFSIAGTLGRVTTVNKEVLPANTNQALAIIRLKSGCLKYITTYLKGKAVSEYIKKNPTIGAQPNLSLEQIENLEILLPKEEEQHQIGEFFNNFDNLITLYQRKLEKMKALKKAYLTEMFPAEGERKPKLRFAGFTDDWEQRKFEDIFKLSQGLQIPISQRFLTEGENKYFYITNEFLKSTCDEKYYIENPPQSVICNQEDILMTRTGNTGIVVTDVEGCFHNNFFKIQYNKELFDKHFIVKLLSTESMKRRILNSAGSSTIPDLSHKSFYKLDSFFPKISEQKKISEFILGLDKIITLHHRKLEKLQNIKKAYLNEMFI